MASTFRRCTLAAVVAATALTGVVTSTAHADPSTPAPTSPTSPAPVAGDGEMDNLSGVPITDPRSEAPAGGNVGVAPQDKKVAANSVHAMTPMAAAASTDPYPVVSKPTANMTVYARSDRTVYTWDKTDNATRKVVRVVHGGEKFVGTQYPGGWLQIASGADKGRWVYGLPAKPQPVPVRNVTRYAGVTYYNNRFGQFSPSGQGMYPKGVYTPLTALHGDYYSNGWMQVNDGGNNRSWTRYTMPTQPYNAFEVRQWQDTSGVRAMAPTSATVTRYVQILRGSANVHNTMGYGTSGVVGHITSGTAVTGHYVNSHWFAITSGTYKGRYVSSGVLMTVKDTASVNGRMKAQDLCTVPTPNRFTMDGHDSSLGCEAVQELVVLSGDMSRAGIAGGVREWEAYRDYATQVAYYKQFGYPRAAVPGTSNHGLGNAIDIHYPNTVMTFSARQVVLFTTYGPNRGWVKPAYLRQGAYNPEPWHFEFYG